MPRPKNANPAATKARILAAARTNVIRMGWKGVSTRRISAIASVTAATVSQTWNGITKIKEELIREPFSRLIDASTHLQEGRDYSINELAIAPLMADPSLGRLVIQVGSCAGGDVESLAEAVFFEDLWSITHEYLAECEIGLQLQRDSSLRGEQVADMILTRYFAAALHVARNPAITAECLIARL